MPLYEHVFIARPDMSPQQAEDLIETYSEIVRSEGGKVGKTEFWGLRNLAYRIKRYRKGHYSLMNIDAPHAAVAEMERRMRLSSEIMRFLTIHVKAHDEKPSPPMLAMSERSSRREATEETEPPEKSVEAGASRDDASEATALEQAPKSQDGKGEIS